MSEIRLLYIAQDPHLTVTLAVVGGACMALAATHHTIICENEFLHLNFQLYDNERGQNLVFIRIQRYEARKNILLNRFAELNNKIDKSWLNLSLETFKVKCKSLFLGVSI